MTIDAVIYEETMNFKYLSNETLYKIMKADDKIRAKKAAAELRKRGVWG